MPDVRDLLIRMSLDSSTFKTNIADAKRELATLKAEYKATASDSSLEDSGAKLLSNLQSQKAAAEALVKEYQKGLQAIDQKLQQTEKGTQAERALITQSQKLQENMAKAETSLNNLKNQIGNVKMDTLVSQAEQLATFFSQLRLGLGPVLEGAGQLADDAYKTYVSREAALTYATKNVEDIHQTTEDINALDKALQNMTTRMPRSYENLAELMGTGATLGVPYESLMRFTEIMGKLETATNVTGEQGAQQMAQFVNLTEHSYENLDRIGSALVALGNSSATTESAILEMAHRSASGLSLVGMGSDDILGLAAALASVGINAEAGGSSLSKLGKRMDEAANVGASSIDALLNVGKRTFRGAFESVYDLYTYLDTTKGAWKDFYAGLGMTAQDSKNLLNSALAAERFAGAMGMTAQQFAAGWNQNAADQMLNFFMSLGTLDADAGENMLWVMDQLGITEIRQSNMVRALANNYQLLGNSLQTARDGYRENIALENEAQRAYSTTESQMAVNRNKQQNALAATGDPMRAWRQPFDDFFGDLKQWYADWPGWAQTAVGAVTDVMGGAGDMLKTAGELSFSMVNIAHLVRDIKSSSAFSAVAGKVGGALGTLGTAALGAGVFGVTYGLLEYVNDVGIKTDDISQKLQNLKITVDSGSKDETLAAIAEVQAAADRLRGGEGSGDYANTSKVVQMGYGTMGMYGTALAYEQARAESEIEGIYAQYGGMIRQAETALLEAQDETARTAAQHQIDALETEMNAKVGEARKSYGETLSAVINGAVRQAADPANLEKIAAQYQAMDMLLQALSANGGSSVGGSSDPQFLERMNGVMAAAGFEETWNLYTQRYANAAVRGGAKSMQAQYVGDLVNGLYNAIAEEVPEVFGNGQLMSILMSALQSGAFENADATGFSGALLGLLEAMDVKQIGDQNTRSWQDIGKNSMAGLGQGITENQSTATGAASSAAQARVDAAKAVLQVHSPSQVFEAIGENVASGLAAGIYAGSGEAIAAAQWLASQIEAAMRSALDIHSPSGVARTLGGYIGAGLADGISGSLGRLERVSGSLAGSVGAVGSRAVNVQLNIDGRKMAEVLTPMVDQVISEANWAN
ncbi:MAG: phage tail tape measure protein [Deltaproteobacteria bacterium]|nr:phage tail tape measure protein [Deltaproteobacteria bacterium]